MINLPLHFDLRCRSLTFWDSYHCSKIGYFFLSNKSLTVISTTEGKCYISPPFVIISKCSLFSLTWTVCRDWTSQASPTLGLKDEGISSWVYNPWTRAQWSHYFGGPGLSSLSLQVLVSGLVWTLRTCSILLMAETFDFNRHDLNPVWSWDCGHCIELLWSSITT